MKALKDMRWKAEIKKVNGVWFWEISTTSNTGIYVNPSYERIKNISSRNFRTRKKAEEHFKEFCDINGFSVNF